MLDRYIDGVAHYFYDSTSFTVQYSDIIQASEISLMVLGNAN